jgi:hypothetical protein
MTQETGYYKVLRFFHTQNNRIIWLLISSLVAVIVLTESIPGDRVSMSLPQKLKGPGVA